MRLAALFLLFFSAALTLAPTVRLHSWFAPLRWMQWIGFVSWYLAFLFADRFTRRHLPDRDPFILPVASLLSGWGLLTIWRLSGDFGLRQTLWLALCVFLLIAGLRLPNNLALLRRYKYLWLIGGLGLIGLTFLFGTYPGGYGPRLWLGCCGVYLQPSELLKLLLIAYLSAYLADHFIAGTSLPRLLAPTLVMTGIAALLLVAQRDLGTATLLVFIYAAITYTATGAKRLAAISLGLVAIVAVAAYFGFDVVRLRIDAWLNPWLDPSGRSYQIVQSLISIASGGLFGHGPGLGSPGAVPVAQSDFIFAAISEETGLAGSIALILLLAIFLVRGLRIAFLAPEPYQRFLAAGITTYQVAQSILIIGGNLRLFPLTGVTLPFVSYGGSSLLISFIALMILLQISNQPEREPATLVTPAPYLYLSGILIVGLLSASILNGWWSIYRSPELVQRTDNPRRSINERYVQRGSLLDRNDRAISATSGAPGSYNRTVTYPLLGSVIGYTDPVYGQAGLENSLDAYLRGEKGYPSSDIFWNNLLYSQPLPGLDVRLTIDLTLQKYVDDALGSSTGAAVLLNAKTGEILAMASHPAFDPNQIANDFPQVSKDPRSPLLDRATQGLYPPGTSLGAFLLADSFTRKNPIPLSGSPQYTLDGKVLPCTLSLPATPSIWTEIASGCPGPAVSMATGIGSSELLALFTRLGFYEGPQISLPVSERAAPTQAQPLDKNAVGQASTIVSPLQMALASAAITMDGVRPAPRLEIAVHTPHQGWVILPNEGISIRVFPVGVAGQVSNILALSNQQVWEAVGSAPNGEANSVTWFLGGTLPDWQGAPLALAAVIETENGPLAKQTGERILQSAITYR